MHRPLGGESIEAPLSTVTAARRGHALVAPVLATIDQAGSSGGGATAPDAPLPTTTTKNRHALVAANLLKFRHDSTGASLDDPLPTITAGGHGPGGEAGAAHAMGIAAVTMVQVGYGEDQHRNGGKGQPARCLDIEQPLGTVVAGGGKHALVTAFMAKHFGGVVGHDMDRPIGTVTSRDHHSLATANLIKLRGQCHGVGMDEPVPTITAGGFHLAEVQAFLTCYYGNEENGQSVEEPLRTVTTKDRFILVQVAGESYQIADVGMRMLEPHELLRAQFGRYAAKYDLTPATTKSGKVRLIGNSVPPEMVEALVRANITSSTMQEAA